MPIYQYRCEACNESFELLRKFSDPPLLVCPHCQAEALRKLIAPVGVIFKGSGFHKNDYSATGAHSSSSSSKSTTSSSDTKSGDGSSAPAKDSGSASDAAAAGKTEASTSKNDSSSSSGDKSSGSSDKVA